MAKETYTLNFMGDTMLGRLVDQLFPNHVDEPDEDRIANSFRTTNPTLMNYGPKSPWGNTLAILHAADLNLLNLETSVTTHPTKWPNKVFNYRMHPENIVALKAANIRYASLANNHTLDFSEPGLLETVETVKSAGISFAGAGKTKDEGARPAILRLPAIDERPDYQIYVWAAADHPQEWAGIDNFHFIDYTQRTKQRLKELLMKQTPAPPALKIFSVHWGPNYAWEPAQEIQDLAHFLIDECGVDIIHGHSSHHVQGIERYKGRLIIYGCGDFVDDYAVTPGFRNDLSAIWQVTVEEQADEGEERRLSLKELKIYPSKIERFMARRLDYGEEDFHWVQEKIKALSGKFNTTVNVASVEEPFATVSLT